MALPRIPEPQRPGALGLLLQLLQRTGWADVTSSDPYLAGTDAIILEPIRPRGATGHPAARVAASGSVVGLVTFDGAGRELDRCSWGFISPHNLERAIDYIHTATQEARA